MTITQSLFNKQLKTELDLLNHDDISKMRQSALWTLDNWDFASYDVRDVKDIANNLLDYDNDTEDDLYDNLHEIADSSVDIYTHNLLEWLASGNNRQYFVNEAVDEYGINTDNFDISKVISMGQYKYFYDLAQSIVQAVHDKYNNEDK